jgi:hypothetical protein
MSILDASAQAMSRRQSNMFQIQMLPGAAVDMIPKRWRHDP